MLMNGRELESLHLLAIFVAFHPHVLAALLNVIVFVPASLEELLRNVFRAHHDLVAALFYLKEMGNLVSSIIFSRRSEAIL